MKKTLRILMFFLVLAGTNANIVFAQKSPTQKTSDEQRIRKITTSFMKRFYQTYDITKIPKSFLVEDFWSHFENDVAVEMLEMPSQTLKKLSKKEKTEYFRSIIDLWVLLDFYNGIAKDDENGNYAEILPKPAVEMLKSSVFLSGLLKNDDDAEPPFQSKTLTVKELRIVLEEFTHLTSILRRSIRNPTKSQNLQYSAYSLKMKERFRGYRREFCTGKGCFGFTENTELFFLTDFPLTFWFVKQNGKFKILGLFPTFD